MRNKHFGVTVVLLLLLATSSFAKGTLRVLQFNIWQEGTVVPDGFNAICDEIVASKADLIAFSEVRNYNNTKFNERIVEALKNRGLVFYGGFSNDTGLISRYPIQSYTALFPVKDDHGSITKAVIRMGNRDLVFYSAHLDYLNCSYYMVRGYSGTDWKELEEPVVNVDILLEDGRKSMRDDAIRALVEDSEAESKAGRICIVGGDFNEPSHRDWIEANAHLYDHNGVVIDWQCTKLLENSGWVDTYRSNYPNPITHPGFTYPAYISDVPLAKLTWAPKSDERERIDFIFYKASNNLVLKKVSIVGPTQSILKSEISKQVTKEKVIEPKAIWPSDHKALLAVFKLKE